MPAARSGISARPGGLVAGDGPTVARLELGDRLRGLRASARIDGATAAAALRASVSKISRMESGQVPVRARDVTDLLTLYGGCDETERAALLGLAKQSGEPGWWDEFPGTLTASMRHHLALESEAAQIWTYDSQAIPALLQTDDYARAVSTGGLDGTAWRGGLGADVLARRRGVLDQPDPPRIWALIQEPALYRAPAGDREILRAQLAELRAAGTRPHITVHIVPDDAASVLAAPGPFSLLRFAPPTVADVVLLELLTTVRCAERRTDVDWHSQLFSTLATDSVTPQDTLEVLDDLVREMTGSPPPGAGGTGRKYLHERIRVIHACREQ